MSDDTMAAARQDLPDYASTLRLHHQTFAADLRAMLVDSLAVPSTPLDIADIACGDGFFSRLLADICPDAQVVGLDSSEAYLSAARQATPPRLSDRVRFQPADALTVEGLDAAFDLVFCADSFESIGEREKLTEQLARLCRPDGQVVITESDSAHDLIGSWPPEVDVLLRQLECTVMDAADRRGYAFPHYAIAMLRHAGLNEISVRSYTFDRTGPFDQVMTQWLAEHFRARLDPVLKIASREQAARLRRHLHPDGDQYFANEPDPRLTYLRFCMIARRPKSD